MLGSISIAAHYSLLMSILNKTGSGGLVFLSMFFALKEISEIICVLLVSIPPQIYTILVLTCLVRRNYNGKVSAMLWFNNVPNNNTAEPII